jgi:hypothetical protein
MLSNAILIVKGRKVVRCRSTEWRSRVKARAQASAGLLSRRTVIPALLKTTRTPAMRRFFEMHLGQAIRTEDPVNLTDQGKGHKIDLKDEIP